MSYSELTVESPSLLKRFSHSKRFEVALELLALECNDEILDYGTGDGFMLKKLLTGNPQTIVGYEPLESQYQQLKQFVDRHQLGNVTIIDDLNRIETHRFDKICCLEVLEHLTEHNQLIALRNIKSLLKRGGLLVVSVPIEVGMSALLKNVVRLLLGQEHQNATILNIAKSCFGLKIGRGREAYICSHVGFDYHDLEKVLVSEGYRIKRRRFSPLKGLGGFVNSQIFYVLEAEA